MSTSIQHYTNSKIHRVCVQVGETSVLQWIFSSQKRTSADDKSKLLTLYSKNTFKNNSFQRKQQQANDRDYKYTQIMRNLVRRYVTVEQRKAESQGVTEDDVNEIKQDISAFRCELVEILKNSGMDINVSAAQNAGRYTQHFSRNNLHSFQNR